MISSFSESDPKTIAQAAYDHVICPMGIGVIAGIADFAMGCSTAATLSLLGVDHARRTPLFWGFSLSSFSRNLWIENCIAPIGEELIFRVVVQGCVKWGAAKIIPDPEKEVDILGCMKLSRVALVSVIASAVFFGMAHYSFGASVIQVTVCSVSGLIFGVLKERAGLVSSVMAHMVANSLIDIGR